MRVSGRVVKTSSAPDPVAPSPATICMPGSCGVGRCSWLRGTLRLSHRDPNVAKNQLLQHFDGFMRAFVGCGATVCPRCHALTDIYKHTEFNRTFPDLRQYQMRPWFHAIRGDIKNHELVPHGCQQPSVHRSPAFHTQQRTLMQTSFLETVHTEWQLALHVCQHVH